MKIRKLATMVLLLIATNIYAQNAVLVNEWVKAGVNQTTGTFGSGGNTPPGLQYDSTGTGTFNASYDYLTPGSPFDGFTVRLENSTGGLVATYTNNNAYTTNITGGWVGTTSASSAVWEGSTSQFTIRNSYSLPSTQQYIDINTRITALTAIDNLYFGRFIDPDARAAAGDSSSTDNVLGYGAIPRKNVAFSEALSSRYALGLYTAQTTGSYGAGISPSWSTNPKDYLNNTNGVNAVRGDYTIGLGFAVSGLSTGDIVNFNYAYIFGPSAFGAASSAITSGAGGGTPGTTPSGSTLTDVGSATSASTSSPPVTSTPSAPTVTGTTTTNTVTSSDSMGTAVATSTVGAAIVTRSGLESVSTQTTTVSTYTPITRTTTTTPVTVTTYSDSTTTTTTGTPVVTTTDVSTTSIAATTTTITESIDRTLPVITGSVAHHVATEASGKQTIARETTTTTTTPLTRATRVAVVTDGTTTSDTTTTDLFNNVDVATANDSFSGRIDQQSALNNINMLMNRNLDMNAFRGDGYGSGDERIYINASGTKTTAGNGYSANTAVYGVAGEKSVTKDWRLGAQYNHAYTKLDGVDSNTTQSRDHFGLFSIYTIEDFKLVNNLGYAYNNVNSNRSIQGIDFNNSHKTNGEDSWLSTKAYTPDMYGFRPFIGYTFGRGTVGGYNELGSIQSARVVSKETNAYDYAEAGLRYEKKFMGEFIASGEVSQTSNSIKTADVRVAYQPTKHGQIALAGIYQNYKDQTSNTISLLGIVRF